MEKLKAIIKKLLIITLYFCLTSNTALANTYKETNKELFFRSGNGQRYNIYNTFYDKNNKLYSLYWYNDNNYLVSWNEKKYILKKIKTPKNILNEITKYHPTLYYNCVMPNGNVGIHYTIRLSDKKTKKLFVIISPDGKLVSKMNLGKIFKITNNENVYYKIHNYKNNRIFVQFSINSYTENEIKFVGVIDYKKKKLLWKRKVSENEGFCGGYSYDFGNIAKNKYMIGFNKNKDKFVISGIKNGKILQELYLDAKKENIVSYEYKNNYIYIVKKDGVYKLKWNEDKMVKLIDLQDHWINKGHNYATDITVVNDNEIYITGYDPGENEKSILFSFKKNF